jgi:hypothetical protein
MIKRTRIKHAVVQKALAMYVIRYCVSMSATRSTNIAARMVKVEARNVNCTVS